MPFSLTSPSIQARPWISAQIPAPKHLILSPGSLSVPALEGHGSCWDRCSPVHPPGCSFKGSALHWLLFHSSLNPSGLIPFFFRLFRSSHPAISAIESDVLGSLLTTASEKRRPPASQSRTLSSGLSLLNHRIFQPRGCTHPQLRAGREPCILESELSAIYTKAPFSLLQRVLQGWGPLTEPRTITPLAKSIHTVILFYVFRVCGFLFFKAECDNALENV